MVEYTKPVCIEIEIDLSKTPIMFTCGNCNASSQAGPNC